MQFGMGFIGKKQVNPIYVIPKGASRNPEENGEAQTLTKHWFSLHFSNLGSENVEKPLVFTVVFSNLGREHVDKSPVFIVCFESGKRTH